MRIGCASPTSVWPGRWPRRPGRSRPGRYWGPPATRRPEQVEGKPLDGRADIYALTLVLYEGVTGEVPFSSDTTIATLMGRVDATLPPHERLGPLNAVLALAAAPDPAQRYTAAELAARLQELGLSLPPPTPLPIIGGMPRRAAPIARPPAQPTGQFPVPPSAQPTGQPSLQPNGPLPGQPTGPLPGQDPARFPVQEAPTIPVAGAVAGALAGDTAVDLPGNGLDRTELGIPASAAGATDARATGVFDFEEGAPGSRKAKKAKKIKQANGGPRKPKAPARDRGRRWPWVVAIIVVVLALLGAGAAWAVHDKVFTPSHPIPSLVGKTVVQARAAVVTDHFTVRQSAHHFDITVPAGLIISQQPASAPANGPPVTAKEGLVINVVVSDGPPPVSFPDLTTFSSCNDAIKALQALHLVGVCPPANEQYSDTAPPGSILSSTPSGTAPYGSTVVISTSKGHQPVAIPDVAGDSYSAAAGVLQAAGFVATQSQAYSPTIGAGSVISTTPDPSAGPQPYGSTVTVNVSLGPQPVPVPSGLNGQTVAKATTALTAAGLTVGSVFGPAGGKVFDTDPVAGTQVLPGATVNLYTK